MQLSNVPAAETPIRLAARKSFALGIYFYVGTQPADITGHVFTLTVGPKRGSGAAVLTKVLEVVDGEAGYARLNLQATETDLAEGEYPYIIDVLTPEGYSGELLRGSIDLVDNPRLDASGVYAGTGAAETITVTLRDSNTLNVSLNYMLPITPSLDLAAMDSRVLAPQLSSFDAFGHSFLSAGVSDSAYLWHQRVAGRLSAQNRNFGQFGALLLDEFLTSRGGYARVMQTLQVTGNFGKSLSTPYTPSPGPIMCVWGHNDAGDGVTSSGTNLVNIVAAYCHAFRSVVSVANAARQVDAAAAEAAFGGAGWGTTNYQNGMYYFYKSSATTGVTLTLTLPASFRGGTVALRMLMNKAGGAIPASTIGCTVDGVAAAPIGLGLNPSTQLGTGTPSQIMTPFRFALTPGAHTIVLTAGVGGMAWDGWHVEASPARPVLWAEIPRTPGMTTQHWVSSQAINAAVAAVAAAEFSPSAVQIVPLNTALNNDPLLFSADNVHPNDAGHSKIAAAFVEAWRTFPFTTAQREFAGGSMTRYAHQTWANSQWYSSGVARGTITPPNGSITYVPFTVEIARTFQAIGIQVTGAGQGGSICRLGVYASDPNGGVGNLLHDLGTVATSSTGVKTITGLSVLLQGRVWLCLNVQASGTTQPTLVSQASQPGNVGSLIGTDFTQPGGGWIDFRNAVAGTLSQISIADHIGNCPLIALQS